MGQQLRGRHEVARRKERLKALIGKIDGAELDAELVAHYSRYLCVLVSGYAEQSIKELVAQYCRTKSNVPIQRFVARSVSQLRNINREKLRDLIESFNAEWWASLEASRPDELEAFGSIATVRNNISHGGDAGMTLATLKQYFDQISSVLDDLSDILDP